MNKHDNKLDKTIILVLISIATITVLFFIFINTLVKNISEIKSNDKMSVDNEISTETLSNVDNSINKKLLDTQELSITLVSYIEHEDKTEFNVVVQNNTETDMNINVSNVYIDNLKSDRLSMNTTIKSKSSTESVITLSGQQTADFTIKFTFNIKNNNTLDSMYSSTQTAIQKNNSELTILKSISLTSAIDSEDTEVTNTSEEISTEQTISTETVENSVESTEENLGDTSESEKSENIEEQGSLETIIGTDKIGYFTLPDKYTSVGDNTWKSPDFVEVHLEYYDNIEAVDAANAIIDSYVQTSSKNNIRFKELYSNKQITDYTDPDTKEEYKMTYYNSIYSIEAALTDGVRNTYVFTSGSDPLSSFTLSVTIPYEFSKDKGEYLGEIMRSYNLEKK